MTISSLKEQIISEVDKLAPDQQQQLLEIARRLQYSSLPAGTFGDVLIEQMEQFEFAPGAVDEMMFIIEEHCARIDG